jgi:hypothetical protein
MVSMDGGEYSKQGVAGLPNPRAAHTRPSTPSVLSLLSPGCRPACCSRRTPSMHFSAPRDPSHMDAPGSVKPFHQGDNNE